MNHSPAPGSLSHVHGQLVGLTHQLRETAPGTHLFQDLARQLHDANAQTTLLREPITNHEQRGTRSLF